MQKLLFFSGKKKKKKKNCCVYADKAFENVTSCKLTTSLVFTNQAVIINKIGMAMFLSGDSNGTA